MISKSVLDNGIRVISEYIPHAHSISLGIWVATGSRHDTVENNGVAHFIEHLLFRGTANRSALEVAREIDSVGGVLNAFTSREYMCFYAKVLSEHISGAVDLLSDIFLNSTFDQEEIEKERKVILQEIWMLKGNPEQYVHDLFTQNFWKSHPLGMSIIGTEESVGALTRDILVSQRDLRFRAEDIIITAAGKVTHDELLVLLNGKFADVPRGSFKEPCQAPVYEKKVNRFDKDLEQVHLCLGTRAFPQDHECRYAGYVLNTVLGGSMSSRLFQEIRENQGLAYSVYSYLSSHSDAGSLVVYAGTGSKRTVDVIRIILAEMLKLKTDAVPEQELTLAKQHMKGSLLLSLESCDTRMTKLAKNEIFFGRQITIKEITGRIEAVTAENLLDLSRELFADEYMTLQLIGKGADTEIDSSLLSF